MGECLRRHGYGRDADRRSDSSSVAASRAARRSADCMPSLAKELRSKMHTTTGDEPQLAMKVYDPDDEAEFKEFAIGAWRSLQVWLNTVT